MANTIKFYDHIPIDMEASKRYFSIQDAVVQTDAGPVNGIYVTVRATHAGRITGNNGLYLPSKMQRGADSMVKPFNKPVGAHHAKSQDPIGRIQVAEYVSTVDSSNTRILNCITDENGLVFGNEIDAVTKLAEAGLLYEDTYEGLGYIRSTAFITDPEAIQKVRDGRYQTVSITVSTDKAICSACKQDWAEDGKCEHDPGDSVDGRPMFLITNELDYEGWDFVNSPADELASVLAISDGKVETVINSKMIPNKDGFNTVLVMSDSLDSTKEPPVEDSLPIDEVTIDSVLEKVIQDSANLTSEDLNIIYSGMEEFLSEDEKLSTEKRKSLPPSAFCGPAKSFPAPDCAHVTAARKLIGRYKGPGSKSAIMSCIDRKAKALGCDSEKEDTKVAAVSFKLDDESKVTGIELTDEASNDLVKNLYFALETQMLTRNLKVDTYSTRIEDLEKRITSFDVAANETSVQLKVLRDELQRAYTEGSQSNVALTDNITLVRHVATSALTSLSALFDDSIDVDMLAKLSVSDLVDKFNAVIADTKVDSLAPNKRAALAKLVSKELAGDGTVPIKDSKTIPDPTLKTDSDKEVDVKVFNKDELLAPQRIIYDEFSEILGNSGKTNASRYLQKLYRTGIINDDFQKKLLGTLDS